MDRTGVHVLLDGRVDQLVLLDQALTGELLGLDAHGQVIAAGTHEVRHGRAAARQMRLAGITALLLDTSPQPQPAAQALATEMGAAYVPLPYAGAQAVSRVVQLASASAR